MGQILNEGDLWAVIANSKRSRILKTASRTAIAAQPFTVFDLAGDPGPGSLNIANTASGVVPVDTDAGFPRLDAFPVGAQGYLTRADASSLVAGRIAIYDLLFKAGAYAFNANTTLAAQPSYAARCTFDGAVSYINTELWLEAVTAFTGNQSIRVQYLDQDGNAGDTGTIATGVAPILGRMFRMPLAAGDSGISRVDVVTSSVATVGTFNVLVLRKLWEGRIRAVNDQIVHGPDLTGLRLMFENSAVYAVITPDSTATSFPEIAFDVGTI